jgi:putative PIN family toxin of toxin-antitoxin system
VPDTTMKLVLDTNAVLDWLHFRDPGFAPIAQVIDTGAAVPLTSAECLEELRRVLAYPQFKLDAGARDAIFDQYRARAELIGVDATALPALPRCRDPDDQKFLELAWHSSADYLVSKDKALLKLARSVAKLGRFVILTPEKFPASGNSL